MALIEIHLDVFVDGQRVTQLGVPYRLCLESDELQAFNYLEADDGNTTTFSALPVSEVTTLEVLLAQAVDQAVGIRLEGSESGATAVRLSAGGLVLVFGGTLTASNITINNGSGSTARVRGLGAG